MESKPNVHVTTCPDAGNLLDELAQECVTTPWERLEGDAFPQAQQATALVEEGAFIIFSQSALDLIVSIQVFAEQHLFEIRELDLLDILSGLKPRFLVKGVAGVLAKHSIGA